MRRRPTDIEVAFLRERHLGTFTTLRADGTPHVVPVGFAYDDGSGPGDAGRDRSAETGGVVVPVVRIITQQGSVKAANAARGGRGAVCQIDGPRWLTLEGTLRLVTDPEGVARAVAAYAERYQPPREKRADTRVAIELRVDRVLGRAG